MKPVMVCQLGSRMHYAVPRVLYGAGLLEHLWTDLYSGAPGLRWVEILNSITKSELLDKLVGRNPKPIPPSYIGSINFEGFGYYLKRTLSRSQDNDLRIHLAAGRTLAAAAIRHGFGKAGAVYAFNSAALHIFQAAKANGIQRILEQTIVPRIVERTILMKASADHPGWTAERFVRSRNFEVFCEQERMEWEIADKILCGSNSVIDAIRIIGGPSEKCIRVPYGVDSLKISSAEAHEDTMNNRHRKLQVLFVGAVSLRKGAPILHAIGQKVGKRHSLTIVGPLQIPEGKRDLLLSNWRYRGVLSRVAVRSVMLASDVLILPSLCEGSATVTYEAMAAGIPVICTPASGSIITHGVDGFLVEPSDVEAFAEYLLALSYQPDLLAKMKSAALAGSHLGSLDAYGRRLLTALS